MAEKRTFWEKPYSERQLIVFAADEVVAAYERIEAMLNEDRKFSINPDSYLDYFKLQLKKSDIDELTRIMGLMRSFFMAKREGVVLRLIPNSAVGQFVLPPGHPRHQVVYVGHPAQVRQYIPLGEFHRLVFEHKLAEVISLLMHLGAKTIQIKQRKGWEVNKFLQSQCLPPVVPALSLAAEEGRIRSLLDIYKSRLAASVEPGAEAKEVKEVKELRDCQENNEPVAVFHTGVSSQVVPQIPDNLSWYRFEPNWQWVSEGRIKFGLKQFIIDLHYGEDFDIHANLRLKLEKSGFHVGREFEEHVPTVWRIFGEFWS